MVECRGRRVLISSARPGALVGQGVHGAQHPIETARREDRGALLGMPVRFAQLQAAQDAQPGKPVAAMIDGAQVTGGIQRGRREDPVRVGQRRQLVDDVRALTRDPEGGVIDVLGEGDGRQPQFHGARAGPLHVPHRRVPGPLTVHVAVARQ